MFWHAAQWMLIFCMFFLFFFSSASFSRKMIISVVFWSWRNDKLHSAGGERNEKKGNQDFKIFENSFLLNKIQNEEKSKSEMLIMINCSCHDWTSLASFATNLRKTRDSLKLHQVFDMRLGKEDFLGLTAWKSNMTKINVWLRDYNRKCHTKRWVINGVKIYELQGANTPKILESNFK